jgi:excisionase family DNA binding protein
VPRSSARSAPQLLTPAEAAQLLSVSPRTITNWIHDDRIPYVTLPSGGYRVPLHALLRSLGGNYDLAQDFRAAQDDDRDEAETRAGEAATRPEHRAVGRI